MPPKMKKTCKRLGAPSDSIKVGKGKEEKENECSYLDFRNRKRFDEVGPGQKKVPQLSAFFPPPSPLKQRKKPPGFWSKKLQDLEENETKNKNKQFGLYEFSGTDESETSFKLKKTSKQRGKMKKKKQATVQKYYEAIERASKGKKIKEIQKQVLYPVSERKNSPNKNTELIQLNGVTQTLGITSTPAVNKGNSIGASNFLFLSPILKAETGHCRVMECSPPGPIVADGSPLTAHLDKGNFMVETKLRRLSCRRVLRNGKMVDT